MRFKVMLLVMLFTVASVSVALGVPKGKMLEFTGSPQGKVIFDGSVHAEKVGSCNKCHNLDLFPKMKKGTVSIKMSDMYQGKYCGACHNGDVTFALAENCSKCHKQ